MHSFATDVGECYIMRNTWVLTLIGMRSLATAGYSSHPEPPVLLAHLSIKSWSDAIRTVTAVANCITMRNTRVSTRNGMPPPTTVGYVPQPAPLVWETHIPIMKVWRSSRPYRSCKMNYIAEHVGSDLKRNASANKCRSPLATCISSLENSHSDKKKFGRNCDRQSRRRMCYNLNWVRCALERNAPTRNHRLRLGNGSSSWRNFHFNQKLFWRHWNRYCC